jgi:hypothetical protein
MTEASWYIWQTRFGQTADIITETKLYLLVRPLGGLVSQTSCLAKVFFTTGLPKLGVTAAPENTVSNYFQTH